MVDLLDRPAFYFDTPQPEGEAGDQRPSPKIVHCRFERRYTISDRGTWLSFHNMGDLTVLVEGDPRLLNRYDVILLNPAKHPVPKQALARRFAQWLVSPEEQAAIGAYHIKWTASSYSTLRPRLQNNERVRL